MIVWLLACPADDPSPAEPRPVELDDAVEVRGAAGEALGFTLAAVGDADGDGVEDLAAGGFLGRVCVFPVDLAADAQSDALPCVTGEPADGFGLAVGGGGLDLAGGTGWAVGAPYAGGAGAGAGAVHALSGVPAGPEAAFATFEGALALDTFGAAVASADFDDDGAVDLVVGAPGVDGFGVPDAGAAYVFFGPFAPGVQPAAASGAEFDGGQLARHPGDPGYALAKAVGVVDADGDGVTDLLLSQGGTDTEHVDAGAVFVFLGPMYRSTVSAAVYADARLMGARPAEYAGEPLLGAGDLTGDGRDDVVAAGNGTTPERVAVFSGPTADATFDEAALRIDAAVAGDLTGWSLAANDVDEDGVLDLLVGAPDGGPAGQGEVRMLVGPASGVVGLADLPAIVGRVAGDQTGLTLAAAGPHGFAIGSPFADGLVGVVSLLDAGWR